MTKIWKKLGLLWDAMCWPKQYWWGRQREWQLEADLECERDNSLEAIAAAYKAGAAHGKCLAGWRDRA